MLTADKQVLLSGFLGQLPERIAARLAKAVEVDRLTGGTGLPHEDILRALRPQLRHSPAPQRMPTPLRLFCRPVEDILVDPERKEKQKGRISRASIDPVWNWLASELMPERHRQLTAAIREAIMRENLADIESGVAALWTDAAAALKAALATEKKKAAAAAKLGDSLAVEDAAEIALLIGAYEEVATLQHRLPKPIVNLSDEDVAYIRDAFDRLTLSNPDLAPYVALIAMGRLERPWEALRLAAVVSRKATDTVIASTDIGVVGELLFADLDVHAQRIQSIRPMDFDPDVLLVSLAGFAELSSGIVKELGIRRDGKWGQRLAKDRAAVAQIMDNLLERAPKEIMGGLPAAKPGAFAKGPKPLDVTRAPDPERVSRSLRYAQILVHSRPFAVAASFSAKLNETMEDFAKDLRSYAEDLLREVRAATPETRVTVDKHFGLLLEICKLVLGAEEADFLRRRSRVH
jgi:hypothetical protein